MFFHEIFRLDKIEGADFKYDNIFSNSSKKYANRTFLVTNVGIFIIKWDFAIRQIRRSLFQINNIIFKIQPKKYPHQVFLVPSLKIIFSKKFCNKTNSRVLISNMTILFLNSSPSKSKLSNFASGKFKEFFAGNFAARQVQGHGSQTWLYFLKYGYICFKFRPRNTQSRHFWSKITK